MSSARVLVEAGALTATGVTVFASGTPASFETRSTATVVDPPSWDDWYTALGAARAASRRASSISASGLEGTDPDVAFAAVVGDVRAEPTSPGASGDRPLFDLAGVAVPTVIPGAGMGPPGAAKGPRDVELPPWSKGRYGTAVGRAVHGVLQAIDLATGADLDSLVAAQCAAEGVVPYADVVHGCVRSALDSDIVRRAAVRQHWRESFLGSVLDDGTVVEGFVDLMYREDDGSTVIVDYKTDDIPDAAVAVRAEYYRPQIKAYSGCVNAAGIPAARGVLLFLDPRKPGRALVVT